MMPKGLKAWLPNLITSGNLFLGTLSILASLSGELQLAVYLLLLAMVLDFFDGLVARMLKVASPFGIQMDSLADVVSFGVAPGIMLYQLISDSLPREETFLSIPALPALFLPVFACIRLARFNLESSTSEGFSGLATPAATLFVCGFPFLIESRFPMFSEIPFWGYYIIIGVLCVLMVSNLPMFSLKFSGKKSGTAIWQAALVVCSLFLAGVLNFAALSPIILVYILFSILKNNLR